MKEKEIRKKLTEILSAAVNGRVENAELAKRISGNDLVHIYRLAKRHDLAHVVSSFVYSNGIEVGEELKNLLQSAEYASIYRHEQMRFAFGQICSAFDAANIPYVPLKGFVIRDFYPYETMRTSCDIDILVHEEDLDKAIKCLEERGYICGKKHYHDVSLYSPNKIHLELHFNIQEDIDCIDVILKDAWKHAGLAECYRYEFSKEFFIYYIYAHMAYHFVGGGCGIRTLMDIWVMEHKMDAPYTCAEKMLKRAGIYKFASEMSRIANECFTHGGGDEFTDTVLQYIYFGGVYGNTENKLAAYKSKNKDSFSYLLERIFLPYRSMTTLYPILKKRPYLLPFCWVARWVKAIFGGKSKSLVREMACSTSISEQKVEEVKEMLSRLGL